MSSGDQHPEFDAAVLALIASLDNGTVFKDAELGILVQGLGRFLRARFQTLNRDDVVEAVNDAVVRFIAAVREGKVDQRARPAAYLTRIASNAAVDLLRLRSHEVSDVEAIDEEPADDAALEALVEALSSKALVIQLMAIAKDRGEHELNLLIAAYRNLAQPGKTPTLRQLAAELGLSHTEVRRQLDRLAALAEELGSS